MRCVLVTLLQPLAWITDVSLQVFRVLVFVVMPDESTVGQSYDLRMRTNEANARPREK